MNYTFESDGGLSAASERRLEELLDRLEIQEAQGHWAAESEGPPGRSPSVPSVPPIGDIAIFFKRDSTEIRQDSTTDSVVHVLDAFKEISEFVSRKGPKARVILHGFASAEGNPAHNRDLSQRRADRIKKLMVEAGIPDAQIVATGHGAVNLFAQAEFNRCVTIELR